MDLDLNAQEKLVLQKLKKPAGGAAAGWHPVYGEGNLDVPLLRGLAAAGLLAFAGEGAAGPGAGDAGHS